MSAKRKCVEKDQQTSDDDDKDQKVDINSLDYDSLAKIFMLLPIAERIEMEKVCTKWKEACQLAWYDIKKYKCELSIGRSYNNRLLTQQYLEKILLMCGIYLNELSLSDVCKASIMPFVGDHCKNLTSLECEFIVKLLIIDVNHIVQGLKQLDKLKCIKIIIEVIHHYDNKTYDLSEIINSFPEEINQIHLGTKHYSSQIELDSMTFKKFKNLQKLIIDDHCSYNIHQEIAEKTTLVHLCIQPYDIHKGFSLFNKLVNLEYIDIPSVPSTRLLKTIFCTCKNLKHLDISSGSYDVADIPLEKWINFQNLEYLGITCTMTSYLAYTIVKYCKNLNYLMIRRGYIKETALKMLTKLKNLECLILLECNDFSEESIIAISNNCKKLKRLEIPKCTIEPGGPPSFPSVLDELSKLQYLEHLNLRAAKNLEDSTIIVIGNNCKYLKSLDIQDCIAITETALVALTNLENLQKLNVCSLNITDDFIIKLKGLKELHCNGCKKLTNAGIIQLIKNNPDLEEISVRGIDNITIDMVIAADQATKNRTNGIILHIQIFDPAIRQASRSIIKSQWLVVEFTRD